MSLGDAIDVAMKQSRYPTQVLLAEALGVDQTTLSKMRNDKVALTVDRVAEIEHLCDLPRGQILVWAGYVDPSLTGGVRRSVVRMEGLTIDDPAYAGITREKLAQAKEETRRVKAATAAAKKAAEAEVTSLRARRRQLDQTREAARRAQRSTAEMARQAADAAGKHDTTPVGRKRKVPRGAAEAPPE